MSRTKPEMFSLPLRLGHARVQRPTSAIVVGGGIAGIAAATVLSERGVRVTLLEAQAELGGRAGSFAECLPSGEIMQMERGFHGFFRQYYTLRALLGRLDPALSMLRELSDYPVLGADGEQQSFRDLPKRTPLQVMALTLRSPHLSARDLAGVNGLAALEMLAYDAERTYARFDGMTAETYLQSLAMPERARRMLFDVFAHSFFNPERAMSAAELLMMFHFYFTGNPEGLIFDVAREPLGVALWQPFARYLQERGVAIELGSRVTAVHAQTSALSNTGVVYRVEHARSVAEGEMLVLALDVGGLQALVEASADLGALAESTSRLSRTYPFAVLRLWLDRPMNAGRAPFAGTTGVGLLDNISVYDRFQGESERWAGLHRGSVVELHAYAVSPELAASDVRADLIAGLHALYPEARAARIVHEHFSMHDDCPAFLPGSYADRPGVATALPSVALAGDGIAAPVPCALMERAAITGFLAANTLLAPLGVASEPIRSVPTLGLFAPPKLLARFAASRGRAKTSEVGT
jgi:isorenieratene synthase